MMNKSVGFVGGGRVTRIILTGLKRAGQMPSAVVVSDSNLEVLQILKENFPEIEITPNDNRTPAGQEVVFIALHPPAFGDMVGELKAGLKPDALLVSLAPKLTIARFSAGLDGFERIVRMIPNAPSVVNQGYNPVAFAPGLPATEKHDLLRWFSLLGACPEVPEEHLEAYAILTAMGPTYLWFQLYELQEIGRSFGLSDEAVAEGVMQMGLGTLKTMIGSGLSAAEVMDLVPVKPLKDDEATIKDLYRSKLEALFKKLKS
ncbi:MAG: NAD(P)-binding domain-containing protein [Anaerolineae bacterium]|nr:NAD(P)-binding domain-containing protein [Anaerolineae bacterium]